MTSTSEPRWLDEEEQSWWRAYIVGTQLLMDQLDRDLRSEHGIAFAEYEILVRLSEAENRSMRMAVLADSLCHSRSRVTHTVTRMEKAGLVRRTGTTEDGRGVVAKMTERGWKRLQAAAPTHVRGVREHLLDMASPAESRTVGAVFDRVADRLLSGHPAETDIRP